MAQLNPNFEIDFTDINSYEQIQLINDTQLAKENLLMHRAYKEPSDDEIIRNHFSSFTFVDFCPKLFSTKQQQKQDPTSVRGSDYEARSKLWELETFSDLFERINTWLKLNKDWRVVSMETLVYDSHSEFNHLKSSIHASYLPQNTRGLRLFLSPSKSRFSGPQRIGCINVVPRKVTGSHMKPDEPIVYETLDEILNRLNELLLTRPIKGRIVSVETITLPMVNGYVNTESNYFVDSKLDQLNKCTYTINPRSAHDLPGELSSSSSLGGDGANLRGQSLIDILRVYYEFGPMVCGLVNLIDFIPRFYSPTPTADQSTCSSPTMDHSVHRDQATIEPSTILKGVPKIAATESLTRLIRRSLAWFEAERKLLLDKTSVGSSEEHGTNSPSEGQAPRSFEGKPVNLKVCNLQVHQMTLLKSALTSVTPENATSIINTRTMVRERISSGPAIVCERCPASSATGAPQDWCPHLIELSEPYKLKYVRLAYVVPVYNRHMRPTRPLPIHQSRFASDQDGELQSIGSSLSSSSSAASSAKSSAASSPTDPSFLASLGLEELQTEQHLASGDLEQQVARGLVDYSKSEALEIVRGTNARHAADELAHQLKQTDDGLNDSPIGQLTYRLFAPCQLVNSSSCFSINPVNSSSPLARRGSLAANSSGISSENANPSTSLLAAGSSTGSTSSVEQPQTSQQQQQPQTQQVVTSFGAFFPALSYDIIAGPTTSADSSGASSSHNHASSSSTTATAGNRFTTNEFESVEAIRRRMEVYVTTNSMKVIAGETLIVNLSDSLSCLSTAIEQTIVKASLGAKRQPSTWVTVYILYAAVEEPQLPEHLLAQQKMRELTLISENREEKSENSEQRQLQRQADILFDDDFKGTLNDKEITRKHGEDNMSSIRIEHNPDNSSLTLYNSAYDRTVALPTQPESRGGFDPVDLLEAADHIWSNDDNDLMLSQNRASSVDFFADARKSRRSKRKRKSKHDDTQCSIM